MALQDARTKVGTWLQGPRPMLVGGTWKQAVSGRTFLTIDPATEKKIADVALGEAADIDLAVAAARRAFERGSPWSRATPRDRAAILRRLAELLKANAEELALLDSLDNGKTFKSAVEGDVDFSVNILNYMAGLADKIEGTVIPVSSTPSPPATDVLVYTRREPVGVVGAIIPWNFPLLMAVFKTAPVLATGCTMVLKPAEQTPLSALRWGELIHEAGVPDGVVNVVPGFGEAGAALASHPDVDKIAFTGSTEVGRLIVKAAAGNLKRMTLELGGKAPIIVFADADIDAAIKGSAHAAFFNHGECCVDGTRVYVERPVYDRVIQGIAERATTYRLGSGQDASTDMGPLISREQMDRVLGYVASGRADGARVVVGGRRVGTVGYFVEPTVLVDVREDMACQREEIFGPVLTIVPFDDAEEAIAAANDTRYGLAAAVWTKDIGKAHKTAAALQAGTVWINAYHTDDASIPRGGYKESGWGRELGLEGISDYLQTKAIIAQL